ncbi:MAG: tripartite tricarboxylate transporter substrate binding protein [Streptosporangiales bacterium]|nr:tripartite tricarboxylate transporter substrate binding protein [Streptosporangiales bacterium]
MRTPRSALVALATLIPLVAAVGCGGPSTQNDVSTYPAKGRTITLIVPYDAGGAGDIGARLLKPYLEKEIGTNIEVVNRPGAGSQVGVSALARAKNDGYTIGFTHLPATIATYLDPARKADFERASLEPVAMYVTDPTALAVSADSPYRTLDDLVRAAKAKPGKVTVTDSGILSDGNIACLRLEEMTGVKFAVVHGGGGAETLADVLGHHTDVGNLNLSGNTAELVRSGKIRLLAIFDKKEDPHFPGVKTGRDEGYPIEVATSRAISAPKGTPKPIVDKISAAIERAMQDPEFQKKATASGLRLSYLDPQQLDTYWSGMEKQVRPLITLAKKG